jgi:hypothetical protein
MTEELSTLIYGSIGGGCAALLLKIIDKYWISPRFTDSFKARKELHLYAKPLWRDCHELEFRLKHIKFLINSKSESLASLKFSPKDAASLEWYTKEGYYVTSTAYLIASVASWIVIFQKNVVFLQFGKRSLTSEFFHLIENFKTAISFKPSILWYYYFNGIGENLILDGQDRPMSLAAFSNRMYTDKLFREYYDQLFQFLKKIAAESYNIQMDKTLFVLKELKQFLEKNGAVPVIINNIEE